MRASLALVALLASAAAIAAAPGFDQVRAGHVSSEAVLVDRNGVPLHELRVDDHVRRLPWTALGEVSPALVAAVVRAEDKRFYEHAGVDWRALGDAAVDTLLRGSPRGASTLSMQVAAMLEPKLKPRGSRRTVAQKWDQIRAAGELERTWSKRQILEAYLNLSTFRGEFDGIAAASYGLFAKDPSGLDERESVLLAALLRGPNAPSATVARRDCALAATTDCGPLEQLAQAHLGRPPVLAPRVALAPHVARQLLSAGARRVQTTLDARIQVLAIDALARQLSLLAGRSVHDGAAIVIDNASGDVLAYVGNGGASASAAFVDGVIARRQAGSTLKPFLYGLAVEQHLLTAASLLDDSPANLVTPNGLYVPQNYDREFRGLASVRTSLAASLNVPAVRTLMLVGTDRFTERLHELGFDGMVESGDFYGFSLALGAADVSLWQLANAFRTLANGGWWSRARLQPGAAPTKPLRVMDADATYIIGDILADRGARSVTFGLDNPLSTRFWSAVKTGTSKDMRDNWCIGFSRRYTVGVWVGNFDGSPMHDVSGVSGAAPAWLDIMNGLHRGDVKAVAPPRPPDVLLQRVRFVPEVEAARDELFLRGTDVAEVAIKHPAGALARIAYPGDGAILAVDPDIPTAVQRVRFLATSGRPGLVWKIDGKPADDADGDLWPPVAGWHELELRDSDGQLLDQVRFEVRGGAAAQR